eukprot:CAMPEP_0202968232 /NCGR_PEP_ID=MMETSP1396-20130829/13466_1 /ASSEMBLY_ACC=CAM_ASM_000872 /TAXON_ID= /ORGANISM="Pseudokeronopsis sp., Strain Brazil" /LENGTH=106 /DNA_ID=CAMNT_0049694325 /DNA_START=210 /DNA_END=528 /DNA_ORIENTATION=+
MTCYASPKSRSESSAPSSSLATPAAPSASSDSESVWAEVADGADVGAGGDVLAGVGYFEELYGAENGDIWNGVCDNALCYDGVHASDGNGHEEAPELLHLLGHDPW